MAPLPSLGPAHGWAAERDPRRYPNAAILMLFGLDILYRSTNADGTIGGTDPLEVTDFWLDVDASGGPRVQTLQQSSGTWGNRCFLVSKQDGSGNSVSIRRGGTDTINGGTGDFVLGAQDQLALVVYAGGGNWRIIRIA